MNNSNDPIYSQFHDFIDSQLIYDLLYIIAKNIHTDDLFHLSNCNASLNSMIHHPIFLKNKLYSIRSMKRYINRKQWNFALQYAAQYGHLEVCKYLVSLGATNFDSALKCATRHDHLDMCKYFVSIGATDFNGALKYVAYHGKLNLCKYFVSLGATDFDRSLEYAILSNRLKICKYLVSLGATNLDYALKLAVQEGHLDICKYLVSIGTFSIADYNTVLSSAAIFGHLDICKYLVSIGANKFNHALNCATRYEYIREYLESIRIVE